MTGIYKPTILGWSRGVAGPPVLLLLVPGRVVRGDTEQLSVSLHVVVVVEDPVSPTDARSRYRVFQSPSGICEPVGYLSQGHV